MRLTAFEQYMLTDDRARYPMTFFIEICVSGILRRTDFEDAIQQALHRHPLLTSLVHKSWRGPKWRAGNVQPSVEWSEGEPRHRSLKERFLDLTKEPGLRVSIGWRPTASRIVFQFHHAAADGIAGIQFIGDVLAFYGQRTADENAASPDVADVVNDQLAIRGQLWEPSHKPGKLLQRMLVKGWEVLHVQPCAVRGSADHPDEKATANPFVTRIVDRATVREIRRQASRWNVTPNELYTLAMFETLLDWNSRNGDSCERSSFRIGIPVSLRTPSHDQSPVANILSYIFLTQSGGQVSDRESLLGYIHRETQAMVNQWDSRLVPLIFDLVRRLPGGLHVLTGIPRRFSTSMLANVGDVKRQLRCRFPIEKGKCVAGNVVLEYLLGAAPNRPGTGLGVSLGTYAGRLFINFNCDPYIFNRTEAELLADVFIGKVNQLVRCSEQPARELSLQSDDVSESAELTIN